MNLTSLTGAGQNEINLASQPFRQERAQNAALDHVQAPEQQGHPAHEIEKNDRAHALRPDRRNIFNGACGSSKRATGS